MSRRPIIHIGVGKTATTTLQNGLLARHPGVHNIGRPWQDPEVRDAVAAMMLLDDLDYDGDKVRSCFRRHAETAAAEGKVLVLSDEALSAVEMPSLVARRLAALLPEAEIVCTLRSQYDLVTSFYLNHALALKDVPKPWNGRHVAFENWFEHAVASFPHSYLGYLRFDRLLRAFADAFGDDRLHVMLYEDLRADAKRYWAAWAGLLGIAEAEVLELVTARNYNERGSQRRARYQALRSVLLPNRSLTSLLPGSAALRRAVGKFLDSGAARDLALSAEDRRTVDRLFAAGNARTAEKYKLDLAGRGYPL